MAQINVSLDQKLTLLLMDYNQWLFQKGYADTDIINEFDQREIKPFIQEKITEFNL